MDEAEFVDLIDARFPYDDLEVGLELAEQACAFSPNAAFAVVDELARPPRGSIAPVAHRLAILERIAEHLAHPLGSLILNIAHRQILDEELSDAEAVDTMQRVSAHPGQLAALSVAYFSCDDVEGVADREYQRIRALWGDVPERAPS
jgi:hypothetical protein